jgi:hypothetical protein
MDGRGRQPSRAAFATQAGALLRKNLRYQRKNWYELQSARRGANLQSPTRMCAPRSRLRALSPRRRAGKLIAAWCSRRWSSPSSSEVRAPCGLRNEWTKG